MKSWLARMTLEAPGRLAAARVLGALERGAAEEEISDAALGLQAAWDWARARMGLTVFGLRFASYPLVTFDAQGREVLDLAAGTVEDASAIDRLCRMAKGAYIRWCERPEEAVGL